MPDALVQVFDDDPLWDDLVSLTRTDEHGYFEVVYDQESFSNLLGLERSPDLYVTVMDRDGNRLCRSPSLPYEAGTTTYFCMRLD